MIIGIDPGLQGAFAFRTVESCVVSDCPVFVPQKGAASIAASLVWKEFMEARAIADTAHAFVERAQAFPGMGGSSAFNYGTGFGIYLGILAALEIPYTLVSPRSWKAHFRLGRDKEQARAAAIRLVPALAHRFARKRDHGRAEATLIALYGWETTNARAL